MSFGKKKGFEVILLYTSLYRYANKREFKKRINHSCLGCTHTEREGINFMIDSNSRDVDWRNARESLRSIIAHIIPIGKSISLKVRQRYPRAQTFQQFDVDIRYTTRVER